MPIIKVEKLRKEFKLRKQDPLIAVNNISFKVEEGEIFGFLGPNGAGKSTTIGILATIISPTSGDAILNNFSVTKDKNQVRKSIGLVFQDPSLDDKLTAEENLKFHAKLYGLNKEEYQTRTKEVLELVDLWERRKSLVKNFSGGMKRRLEIARGLIHYPKILFLDEPTLGLDPQTRKHIWEYIFRIKKERGMTVFMTTHYMPEAENCDRLAIIDAGKIIAQDTPAHLKEKLNCQSLDDVFLALTGKDMREENASSADLMRQQSKMRRGH